ncbi:guanylate kinase [Campylobacter canadensis]|uniref:guanylate kinase n=1 Tax=Campylobacter canadensis TaxID=449520 RepID=UPI001553C1FA|nr:guanylate kinase [Campylobacter canadensis]MBZ7995479.1 guanylate kinase [Campylobacter canadensis]MBZ7997285.1 guanylate kinase [Campylobacter canadensis]MBZ7998998.1 guanylate kinase [Campylobacter canadensis]MBZ8000813.1 guanylate kinase [Campylobacter canadensis]MBZ8002618.1 guanylate kinase [Campylobacter canadensis]
MAGILLISGPSGAGKSTLLEKLASEFDDFYFSISSTTRKIRAGEKEGVNYYYLSQEEFENGIKNDEFLEYANVHGNYYGTPVKPIYDALTNGKNVILDIDVQGFRIVKDKLGKDFLSVFITPQSEKVLKERLYNRGTENEEVIAKRLHNATAEVQAIGRYDFFIINDDLDKAYEQLKLLYKAASLKVLNSNIKEFISNWKKGE